MLLFADTRGAKSVLGSFISTGSPTSRLPEYREGNFEMFRELCGDNALHKVVIVTQMWGQVDVEVGKEREAELKREDDFEARSRRWRSDGTSREYRSLGGKKRPSHPSDNPLPLHIQKGLVD